MDFDPVCQFLYFCGQLVVSVIMLDGSKTRKSLAGLTFRVPMLFEGTVTETLIKDTVELRNSENQPYYF